MIKSSQDSLFYTTCHIVLNSLYLVHHMVNTGQSAPKSVSEVSILGG